ncbi:hypothetical protein J6590_028586, partial [Homalodisca vitripennis]
MGRETSKDMRFKTTRVIRESYHVSHTVTTVLVVNLFHLVKLIQLLRDYLWCPEQARDLFRALHSGATRFRA